MSMRAGEGDGGFAMSRHRADGGGAAGRALGALPPDLARLEAYWQALRHGDSLPCRSDVLPAGLGDCLPSAFVLERLAPGVARLRLAGSALTELMGMEVRGMPLSVFFTPEARPAAADAIEAVFDGPMILDIGLDAERGITRPALRARMLVLPLRDETGAVTRALGALQADGGIGRAPRRFRIEGHVAHRLPRAPGAPAASEKLGLAEPHAPFVPAPSGRTEGPDDRRPALRLVGGTEYEPGAAKF